MKEQTSESHLIDVVGGGEVAHLEHDMVPMESLLKLTHMTPSLRLCHGRGIRCAIHENDEFWSG
jgi:hypothetical protein